MKIDLTDINKTWEEVCEKYKKFQEKYGHLEHTEELEELREFRNNLTNMSQEVQQEIDRVIIKNHKIPELRNAYLKKTDDDTIIYFHVADTEGCVERLFKGVRVRLQSECTLYAGGGCTLWTYPSDDMGETSFSWKTFETDSDSVEKLEFVTKEEYLQEIQKALTTL